MKKLLLFLMMLAFALPPAWAGLQTVTINRNEGQFEESNGVYYCNAYYAIKTRHYSMWEDGRYEKLADDLRRAQGRTGIPVELKMRKGEPVDFKIDLTKLAAAVGNGDIENLELTGWGFFDHPTDL